MKTLFKNFKAIFIVLLGFVAAVIIIIASYHDHSAPQGAQHQRHSSVNVDRNIKGRILFMAASYDLRQFIHLWKVIEGYRDICEAGWDVDIALQVANGINEGSFEHQELRQSSFCQRIGRHLNITYQPYDKIGFGLNSRHRTVIQRRLHGYDYFIYSEEDMLFTPHHMAAFVKHQRRLQFFFPETWRDYTLGYLRYEERNESLTQVSWEYMPDKIHMVQLEDDVLRRYRRSSPDEAHDNTVVGTAGYDADFGRYLVTNNLNQALYIMTRDQVAYLEDRCAFLSAPGRNAFFFQLRKALHREWKYLSVGISEWSSSFQQVLQCGLRRVVPVSDFQSFRLHHLPNKAQKRRLRKELLTWQNWQDLLESKRHSLSNLSYLYGHVIYQQYNLHLLDYAALDQQNVKYVQLR